MAKRLSCCEQTLLQAGRVIRSNGTVICTTGCRDGEKIKCKTCKRTLVHICDEAEGCHWLARL